MNLYTPWFTKLDISGIIYSICYSAISLLSTYLFNSPQEKSQGSVALFVITAEHILPLVEIPPIK